MNETTEPKEPETQDHGPSIPPLRIHHLLIWMTATAAIISAVLWFDHSMRNGPPITNVTVNAALTVMAIASAGALCCAGWGIYWHGSGHLFPIDPGERLVMLVAAAIVGFLAVTILSSAVFFLLSHDLFPVAWVGLRLALLATLMASCAYVASWRCDTIPWRFVFLVLASVPLIVWVIGAAAGAVATLVALIVAAGNDWRRRISRRWTHWLGVGVLAAIALSCGVISLIPSAEYSPASSWLR